MHVEIASLRASSGEAKLIASRSVDIPDAASTNQRHGAGGYSTVEPFIHLPPNSARSSRSTSALSASTRFAC